MLFDFGPCQLPSQFAYETHAPILELSERLAPRRFRPRQELPGADEYRKSGDSDGYGPDIHRAETERVGERAGDDRADSCADLVGHAIGRHSPTARLRVGEVHGERGRS